MLEGYVQIQQHKEVITNILLAWQRRRRRKSGWRSESCFHTLRGIVYVSIMLIDLKGGGHPSGGGNRGGGVGLDFPQFSDSCHHLMGFISTSSVLFVHSAVLAI